MSIYNLVSFTGLFVFMAVAWCLSTNRRVINWRLIAWGITFQLLFAGFVFAVPAGRAVFAVLNDAVIVVAR